MRVISGQFGARKLQTPAGSATRPTSDRVREALFSILAGRLTGARVLDLFAGSGALGIEALSRGAAHADLVDNAAPALRAIRANLLALGITTSADVHDRDARAYVRSALEARRQYDLVFLDPPYRLAGHLAEALADTLPALLSEDGLVIGESDRRAPLDIPSLTIQDERRYGDTLIRIHGF